MPPTTRASTNRTVKMRKHRFTAELRGSDWKCKRKEERGPHCQPALKQAQSGCGLDVGDVDGFGRLVVGSRDLDVLTGNVGRFLLIVEFVDGLLGGVEEHVLSAHLDAVFGAHRPAHGV